jgi:hypothetical protein
MVRRRLAMMVGGFEEHFTGQKLLYDDQGFLAKIYLVAPVYFSSKTWIKYRQHADSCVASVNNAGKYHEVRLFFLDWFEVYLKNKSKVDRRVLAALKRALRPYQRPRIDYSSLRLAPFSVRGVTWKCHRRGTVQMNAVNAAGRQHAVEAEISDAVCECGNRLLYCRSRLGKHAFNEHGFSSSLVGRWDSARSGDRIRHLTTQDESCGRRGISHIKEVRDHDVTNIAKTEHLGIRTNAAYDDAIVTPNVKDADFPVEIFDVYSRYRLIVDPKRYL